MGDVDVRASGRPLRVAALVKQVPRFEAMSLGSDGRLVRDGLDLEMNPYCRRAVAAAVAIAQQTGGTSTVLSGGADNSRLSSPAEPASRSSDAVSLGLRLRAQPLSLGPPAAEDALREALAWGADDTVLVSDPAFAGSDTLATARALAAALALESTFDLVFVGRNSVDADTGQVGPELAELLDMAFVSGARTLDVADEVVRARLEHDDGWARVEAALPAVVSCAERLCPPCKAPPDARAAVSSARVRHRTAAELGMGPWGEAGSPTRVGEVRQLGSSRERRVLVGPLEAQVAGVVELLVERGLAGAGRRPEHLSVPGHVPPPRSTKVAARRVAVVAEPGRYALTQELLGGAAALAESIGGTAVALVPYAIADVGALSSWGADEVVLVERSTIAEDVAAAIARWCARQEPSEAAPVGAAPETPRRLTCSPASPARTTVSCPRPLWGVLAPSTMWGREVAGRVAARLGAGLIGDAIELTERDGELVAWKPAFGGALVAAVTSRSRVQIVTVRAGVLPRLVPRSSGRPTVASLDAGTRGRIRVLEAGRDDDLNTLARASTIVAVGAGVPRERYGELEPLLSVFGAELAATRKVTDEGWLPRARQIGITGRSVRPDLYIAIGLSGRFNHMVGAQGAGTILAINSDPASPVFEACDLGIVGDWREVVPLLVAIVRRASGRRIDRPVLTSTD